MTRFALIRLSARWTVAYLIILGRFRAAGLRGAPLRSLCMETRAPTEQRSPKLRLGKTAMSRRVALGTVSLLAPAAAGARSDSKFDDPLAVEVKSPRPLTYEVDFTDPPTLVPRTSSGAFRLLKDIVG